jgi:phospholipid transport system transporter-binding protein
MAEQPIERAGLQVHGDTLTLSGEISFATVNPLVAKGREAIGALSLDNAVLDLSAVSKTDSAGLALVVDWVRSARHRRVDLRIVGVSAQLADIARVSGLEDFLAGAG